MLGDNYRSMYVVLVPGLGTNISVVTSRYDQAICESELEPGSLAAWQSGSLGTNHVKAYNPGIPAT